MPSSPERRVRPPPFAAVVFGPVPKIGGENKNRGRGDTDKGELIAKVMPAETEHNSVR
jgi:hypothetical protein